MRGAGWLTGLVAVLACTSAQTADPYQIKMIRWDEDYSYLAGQDAHGVEQLKFISLAADDSAWLTLGGEGKYRVDLVENSAFNLRPGGDFISRQTRLLFHTDWHFGSFARAFVQLGYADEAGRQPTSRSFDESNIDLQQGFIDLSLEPVRFRGGRQELPLGNQRLSEVREGFNIRRSFDGARLDLMVAKFDAIAFWGQPVFNEPGAFDDTATKGESFYGVYVSNPFAFRSAGIDLFWLARKKPSATFVEGVAAERRDSFGARLFGMSHGWDYDVQALVQDGEFGAGIIFAYAATGDVGWTATDWPWHPRFGIRADLGSGDARKGDGELGSFDAPYPNSSYLTVGSAYWAGNSWTIFPLLTLAPDDATTLYLGASYMARISDGDGFYYQQQNPFLLTGTAADGLMNQAYGRVKWQPDRYFSFTGTVILQVPGTAMQDLGADDIFIASVSTNVKF